jgi:hypothetical protein
LDDKRNVDKNLHQLRHEFDQQCLRHKLSTKTALRYRAWIRRYLVFVKHCGSQISIESLVAFLRSYPAFTTRRQGFYALKFFFVAVLAKQFPIDLACCEPEPRRNVWRKGKWWQRLGWLSGKD